MNSPLNSPDSRQSILTERAAQGLPLSLSGLAEEFGVSPDTIRRDLLALEAAGAVRRVRGGALPVVTPAGPVLERLMTADDAAERIAAAALSLIEDGMVLMFDGGSTVMRLARSLPALPRALVVTPAPAVALATMSKGIETILVGGRLSGFGGIAVGQAAVAAIADIAADLCFLGACGLSADFGLSADNPDEAAVKRAMCSAAPRAVVLTGAAKLGRRARHRVVACADLDLLITDAGGAETAALSDAVLEVRHV
ncbi:DeoR/GlpR family DNA-binding transcription regulator [Tropicimonas sp. IMCC34043]|uniref:DeoR/GlpR family DNA-binding transcription regulator n=1 Tax=Tropicimonas sp. IMCC34043 TaxID=2248760 RepID=UPI0018E5237D|nr:DeoR/GlpR family DNA-binding transcription regulator [Tropicimonas sp. IMCC34043]